MGLNFGHVKTLQGILKLVSIFLVLCAAAVGVSAILNSEYNKSCRNDEPLPPEIPIGGTDNTAPSESGPTTTTLRWRTTTTIPTSSSQPQTTTTTENIETSTEEEEEKDMAPVLWMEAFHVGICFIGFVASVILLILFLVFESSETSKVFKAISFSYHFVWCVLLIVSSIFMGYAAIEIDRQICQVRMYESRQDCQQYFQKMVAAGLSLLTAILYGIISCIVISTKLYVEV